MPSYLSYKLQDIVNGRHFVSYKPPTAEWIAVRRGKRRFLIDAEYNTRAAPTPTAPATNL